MAGLRGAIRGLPQRVVRWGEEAGCQVGGIQGSSTMTSDGFGNPCHFLKPGRTLRADGEENVRQPATQDRFQPRRSSCVSLNRNSQSFAECACEPGCAYEVPMRPREREECLLAGAIRTSNPVEIDLHFPIRTAVSNSPWQALCPFPDQLSS